MDVPKALGMNELMATLEHAAEDIECKEFY